LRWKREVDPGTRNGRDSRSGGRIEKAKQATPDATKEEKVNCIEGAKAYAPFGAGRETGHQVPAVAAKKEGKTINMEAELPLKPCEKKREKEREKQRREMGEK
jgi:hypothetical protein